MAIKRVRHNMQNWYTHVPKGAMMPNHKGCFGHNSGVRSVVIALREEASICDRPTRYGHVVPRECLKNASMTTF